VSDRTEHPFVKRLLRASANLHKGESSDVHGVLATYRTRDCRSPFAFCAEGLLIDPDGEARFVPYSEIEDSGYYDVEMLKASKRTLELGEALEAEVLPLKLRNGEKIDLPLEVREDGMSERLAIGGLVEQRVRIHRPDGRRADS
jgi:hypothetical protein